MLRVLKRAPLPSAAVTSHREWRHDAGVAGHALDPQAGITFDRIMRLDGLDHALHALHHCGEVDAGGRRAQAEFAGTAHLRRQPGAA